MGREGQRNNRHTHIWQGGQSDTRERDAALRDGGRFVSGGGGKGREDSALRVASSQRSSTPEFTSAEATFGHTVGRRDLCTISVSAALQAAG